MKTIPLSKGFVAKVDDEDYERLAQFKWHTLDARGFLYAARRDREDRHLILMHRDILSCPDGMYGDHINHDTLDNQKSNLRIVTRSQNASNQKRHIDSHTPYMGVNCVYTTKKGEKRYAAYFRGKCVGYAASPEEAHIHYLSAKAEYFSSTL